MNYLLRRADVDSVKALLIVPCLARASLFVIKALSINFSYVLSLTKMCACARPPHVFSFNNFCKKVLLHQAVLERPLHFHTVIFVD